jgi:A/G-specific adenine glycosylase
MTPEQFQAAVLAWYDRHGRRNLPWQRDITPYRVWVSEIMLQQTQVRTVIPYFERFMARLPSVEDLARASEDDVLHLWSGLGYYSRGRNLHRTAARIVTDFDGQFPDDVATLSTLPGIGRSTAGAIVAIAHRQRAIILDGNVKRVLARMYAVDGWPGRSKVLEALWTFADQCTPTARVGDYTQAMMDLGATVCTRSKPRCGVCPLATSCAARASGDTARYPGKKPRRTLPVKHSRMLIVENQRGEVALYKRPPTGVWGSLWAFPELPEGEELASYCQDRWHSPPRSCEHWPLLRHTFSHFHLDIEPLHLRVDIPTDRLGEGGDLLWYQPARPPAVGLAAPALKLLGQLAARQQPLPLETANLGVSP